MEKVERSQWEIRLFHPQHHTTQGCLWCQLRAWAQGDPGKGFLIVGPLGDKAHWLSDELGGWRRQVCGWRLLGLRGQGVGVEKGASTWEPHRLYLGHMALYNESEEDGSKGWNLQRRARAT